jgi:hypothetical protein
MTKLKKLVAGASGVALLLSGAFAAPAAGTSGYDLAGLWLFNEASGQKAHDLSFSGNTGQLGSTSTVDDNDPTRVALPSLFFRRGALRFDGGDFVKVPDAPSLEPDGVTVIARVRATSPGTHRYVVAKGALECETASYGLYTGGTGGLRFYISDGTDYTLSAAASDGLWDGRWHTVVGAYDGSQLRLWVDGTLVGEPVLADVAIGYGLPTDDNFYIGTYAGPCSGIIEPGFRGDMDGVAVVGTYAGKSLGGTVD